MINVKREILMLKKKWYATNQRDNLEQKSAHQLVKKSKRFKNVVTFYSLRGKLFSWCGYLHSKNRKFNLP